MCILSLYASLLFCQSNYSNTMLRAVPINQALLLNFFFKISIYLLLPLNWSYCLMGARSPEVPTIIPQVTKISNKKPKWAPKAHDSQANCRWTNGKIPCLFCTFETKTCSLSWSKLWHDNFGCLVSYSLKD